MLDLLVNPSEGIINNVNRKINKIERCKKKKQDTIVKNAVKVKGYLSSF